MKGLEAFPHSGTTWPRLLLYYSLVALLPLVILHTRTAFSSSFSSFFSTPRPRAGRYCTSPSQVGILSDRQRSMADDLVCSGLPKAMNPEHCPQPQLIINGNVVQYGLPSWALTLPHFPIMYILQRNTAKEYCKGELQRSTTAEEYCKGVLQKECCRG